MVIKATIKLHFFNRCSYISNHFPLLLIYCSSPCHFHWPSPHTRNNDTFEPLHRKPVVHHWQITVPCFGISPAVFENLDYGPETTTTTGRKTPSQAKLKTNVSSQLKKKLCTKKKRKMHFVSISVQNTHISRTNKKWKLIFPLKMPKLV